MLPYFNFSTLALGPLTIYVWGLFVALGIALFLWLVKFEARARQVSYERLLDLSVWVLVAAFVGARVFHVLFYEPTWFWAHPIEIIKIWHGGMSSTGGMVFGVSVALIYIWRHKLSAILYGDVICRMLPAAWILGRMGCYLTHMHPGRLSSAWFAVAVPAGARLDLGLIEAVAWLVIGVIFWALPRQRRAGFYISALLLIYPVVRFGLDFLRATDTAMPDARYFGLTPAQYVMIGLFALGLFLTYQWRNLKKYDARRN